MENKYQFEDSDYLLSLTKIAGKEIKDIGGYVIREFGDPVFKITQIKFNDGSVEHLEGEHDIAYVCLDEDLLNEVEPEETE